MNKTTRVYASYSVAFQSHHSRRLKCFTFAVGGTFKGRVGAPHICAAASAGFPCGSAATSTSPACVDVAVPLGLGGHLAASRLQSLHLTGFKVLPVTAVSVNTVSID